MSDSEHGSKNSSYPENDKIVASQKNKYTPSKVFIEDFEEIEIISLRQALWFWLQRSGWSYFARGLIWGVIVGLTAIVSASGGVALTKIDGVEKTIAQMIDVDSSLVSAMDENSLDKPIDILLLEVKPSDDEMLRLSQSFGGNIQNVLVLRLNPQSDTTEVINIPVDSRVKIPGYGWGTIADANMYGGTKLVSQMVGQLLNDVTIDSYIKATPKTFQKLIASGKIAINDCVRRQTCTSKSEQILRQQNTVEVIRQRLNIPSYLNSFETTFDKIKPNLDTNLSASEVMSIANFVKELDPQEIEVNLLPNYISGKIIQVDTKLAKTSASNNKYASLQSIKRNVEHSVDGDRPIKIPVAVQNTTNSPELGMKLVAYLRDKNFQDVYLVEHLPLKLNKTRIITDQSQLPKARHLQKILGLDGLESNYPTRTLTIQVGQDARILLDNSSL